MLAQLCSLPKALECGGSDNTLLSNHYTQRICSSPEGSKVEQPRAMPWVRMVYISQPEGLQEAFSNLFRSNCNKYFSYESLAALQAADVICSDPGHCPGLFHFRALRAHSKVRYISHFDGNDAVLKLQSALRKRGNDADL